MLSLRNALFVGTAMLGVAAAANANATPMTQTVTVGTNGNPTVTTDLNNVAFNSMINQFNAATIAAANPGNTVTLNDVILTLNTVVQTGGSLQNQASQAQSFQFDLKLASFVAGSGSGSATAAQGIVLQDFGQFTAGNQSIDFGTQTYQNVASNGTVGYPNAATTTGTTSKTASPTITLTDADSLAAFSGTGSFGIGLNTTTTQATTGGGGNIAINLNTTAGGSFSVEYDYTLTPIVTTVPEPASFALLGAGVLGLGMLRRRRA